MIVYKTTKEIVEEKNRNKDEIVFIPNQHCTPTPIKNEILDAMRKHYDIQSGDIKYTVGKGFKND